MSLYNMMNGVKPATFFILPMLGKHPNAYPRFRDCFTEDDEHPEYNDHIHIYTRTGGGNREDYESENGEMKSHKNFISDFDDDFDSTFASWVFSVPDEWKPDYEKITSGNLKDVSEEYQKMVRGIFPKLEETFNNLCG